ncbi:YybH family protein [Sphingomicrobium flavum]|uniref:YybH family protein n=1 Tax=Sphingomicrobium flavum TaxID=1229164 RepID=UPI0021ADA453|nr:nuclear transport factor 2 family protein [Sphingomicrobium flavum]
MTSMSSDVHQLHHDYVAAINSNNVDAVLALCDENVIYQAPNEPQMEGAEAVREWGSSFFAAFKAHWVKTTTLVEASDRLASSTYTYVGTYTDKETGDAMTEHGKGTCLYRRGDDGNWKLIVDTWSLDAA